MTARVLFVDDEAGVLEGIRRTLGRRIGLATAIGPQEGLRVIGDSAPFAVVVSDMRMPGMSGAEFLAEVRRRCPNTVRMILSGHSDLDATIAAVNDGHVFRFLTKPCTPESLFAAVSSGLEQYDLIMAEKELLEQTLSGAVQVLTDILAIVSPDAYGRASRITRYADAMAGALDVPDRWQIRLAAMLSQIGWVALPEELAEKFGAGQTLDAREQQQVAQYRSISARLISSIPRLGRVAAIIADASQPPTAPSEARRAHTADVITTGRVILEVAAEFDRLVSSGVPRRTAISRVASAVDLPHRAVEALALMQESTEQVIHRTLRVHDLRPGMVLDEDVLSLKGLRLVRGGQEVTSTLIARLRSYTEGIGVMEPVRVRVPA
ncbi:MAG: response regulator [Steroidobacteraceae bacterium]